MLVCSPGGYGHKSVNHGRGEFARDEDGDGLCEVHVNTMEGFWSLLRSWLRPHRGIAQEKLPLYLGFFEWLLLDSRVVDEPMASNPTFVILSAWKPLFFKSLKNELRFSDNAGA